MRDQSESASTASDSEVTTTGAPAGRSPPSPGRRRRGAPGAAGRDAGGHRGQHGRGDLRPHEHRPRPGPRDGGRQRGRRHARPEHAGPHPTLGERCREHVQREDVVVPRRAREEHRRLGAEPAAQAAPVLPQGLDGGLAEQVLHLDTVAGPGPGLPRGHENGAQQRVVRRDDTVGGERLLDDLRGGVDVEAAGRPRQALHPRPRPGDGEHTPARTAGAPHGPASPAGPSPPEGPSSPGPSPGPSPRRRPRRRARRRAGPPGRPARGCGRRG